MKNSFTKWSMAVALGFGLSANLAASYQVETIAGSAGVYAHTDGVGAAARFKHPGMMSIDNGANLLIADDDKAVRKVTTSGGIYNASTLFYADNVFGSEPLDAICQYIVGGTTTYLTTHQYIDLMQWTQSGGTYVSNTSLDRGGAGYPSDGDAWGLVIDSSNNIFMTSSSENRIYKILPDGSYSVFVEDAALGELTGITIDSSNNLYVSATGNNTICKIASDGIITVIAGTEGSSGSSDGIGSAARFNSPWDLDIDGDGTLYVADQGNNLIRKLTNNSGTYTVSTIAGLAGSTGSSDGVGSAARFNAPTGLAVDALGNIYISDTNNNTIRKLFLPIQVHFITGAHYSGPVTGGIIFTGSNADDVCTFDGHATDDVQVTVGKISMSSATPIASERSMRLNGGDLMATANDADVTLPTVAMDQDATLYANVATAGHQIDLVALTGSGALTIATIDSSPSDASIHLGNLSGNSGGIAACSQAIFINSSTQFPTAASFFEGDATVSALPTAASVDLTFGTINSTAYDMPANGLTSATLYASALNIGSKKWQQDVSVKTTISEGGPA